MPLSAKNILPVPSWNKAMQPAFHTTGLSGGASRRCGESGIAARNICAAAVFNVNPAFQPVP
ncbi:MAG TPA: hypothetical protein VF194_08280 [Ferrovibrio sp.]|jgi:hypothetical protein